jgi:hypothetical protein
MSLKIIIHTEAVSVPRQNVRRHNVRRDKTFGDLTSAGHNVRRDKTSGRTKRPEDQTSGRPKLPGTKRPETYIKKSPEGQNVPIHNIVLDYFNIQYLHIKNFNYVSGRFVPPDVLSHGCFVSGCFVSTDVLSVRMFCPTGRFVPPDI